jgi:ubiquinone/menaquinone biosynthesis C-methylase UbiE
MLRRGAFSGRVVKLLISPVAYWRTVEYQMALALLAPRSGERILDVSSPKLLALYLASHRRCRVVATDIEGDFVREWEAARATLDLTARELEFRVEDARALSFPARSFDAAYCISVLEHIPGMGDLDAVRELARVLEPGGRLLLTVPFAKVGRDEYVDAGRFYWSRVSERAADGRAFFQRRYDEQALRDRLIEPSGLHVEAIRYHGERVLLDHPEREVNDFLPAIAGPFHPSLAKALVVGPTDDWRELAKPLCATLLLSKPIRTDTSSAGR